ncbi:MAG: tRNA lysidine(34) synthetase TilS [Legionella sp.]|nr:tRNA lysidine(34) synthetase TilS [Legionella sp.]
MWGLDSAIHKRLLSSRRLWVGLSGGLDSTVLLHLLASNNQLRDKLHAVHIHHGLSQHADAWHTHCKAFCAQYHIQFTLKSIQFNKTANLEATARDARRAVFDALIHPSDCLLLAHHKNDQAETLLLNLLRGTGIDGLAAMPQTQPFGEGDLIRPLLHLTREDLNAYAKQHALTWIEDESNQDTHFSRNYLRHEILPRLKTRWPDALSALNTCATHAQAATKNLDDLAYLDCPELALKPLKLELHALYDLPRQRLAQVLRTWLKQHNIKLPTTGVLHALITEVIFARQDATPCVRFHHIAIRRYQDVLYLVRETELVCKASNTKRFRQGGERMRWRGHTRSLKYIFQTLGVPPWLRDTIPLIFVDNTLVAVLDFAIADGYTKEDVYDTV